MSLHTIAHMAAIANICLTTARDEDAICSANMTMVADDTIEIYITTYMHNSGVMLIIRFMPHAVTLVLPEYNCATVLAYMRDAPAEQLAAECICAFRNTLGIPVETTDMPPDTNCGIPAAPEIESPNNAFAANMCGNPVGLPSNIFAATGFGIPAAPEIESPDNVFAHTTRKRGAHNHPDASGTKRPRI